jgi:predicted nuclease with TOPRIM domain
MTKTENERLTRLETIYENQAKILDKMEQTLSRMEESLVELNNRDKEVAAIRERIEKLEKIISSANKLLWTAIGTALLGLVLMKPF